MSKNYNLRDSNIFCYVFIVALVVALSCYRMSVNNENMMYDNYDATYHTLLTLHALDETPAAIHKWLPIITLGEELDKDVPWGATKSDDRGHYFYTSIPQLTFLIPYVFFKVFNAEISLTNLIYFNFLVGLLASISLFILLKNQTRSFFKSDSNLPALLGVVAYSTSTEFLFSHGYVYWGQSIFQIFFIAFLLSFNNVFVRKSDKSLIPLFLFGFLMASTEWTGYIALLVSIVVALYGFLESEKYAIKVLSILILSGLSSLAVFLIPFFSVLNYKTLFSTIMERFFDRAIVNQTPIITLFEGYWNSFGLVVVVGVIGSIALVFTHIKNRNNHNHRLYCWLFVIAFFTVFIENILLKQHAITYHYDRLKLIIPIAMLIPFMWTAKSKFTYLVRVSLVLTVLVSSIISIFSYENIHGRFSSSRLYRYDGFENNKLFAEKIDFDNTVLGISFASSCYKDILFHKNVYINYSASLLADLAVKKKAAKSAYIDGEPVLSGAFKIKSISVFDLNNSTMTRYSFSSCDEKLTSTKSTKELHKCKYSFDNLIEKTASDINNIDTVHGIIKNKAGFFLMGMVMNEHAYKVGRQIKFYDGSVRKIIEVNRREPFLEVLVSGSVLDGSRVGFPHPIEVVGKSTL